MIWCACAVPVQCLADIDGIYFEVKISQRECQHFSTAHARIKKHLEGSVYPDVAYILDKGTVLFQCPKVQRIMSQTWRKT